MTISINRYKNYLELLTDISNKESFKYIYKKIEIYLKQDKNSIICAFSMKRGGDIDKKSLRILTDKKYFDIAQKKIHKSFDAILNNQTPKNLYKIYSYDNQEIYCYFEYKKEMEDIINHLISFLSYHHDKINNLKKIKRFKKLSDTDDVSGLFNQRKLRSDLTKLINKYNKTEESFSILFLDIDHYKLVNDGHGHVVGTELLLQLGKLLSSEMRDSDFLYRYGGDEFVVILHDIDCETAEFVANRFLDLVKKTEFNALGNIFRLSVSIGVATFPDHATTAREIIEMSDNMMYQAKKNGRGRVCRAKRG